MVRLIMGANGAGKTKQLIDLIHNAVEAENGSVVCMEPSADMTYNISYNVRLVNASEYSVDSFECLRGFISGLYAGNYDISHCFRGQPVQDRRHQRPDGGGEVPELAGALQ